MISRFQLILLLVISVIFVSCKDDKDPVKPELQVPPTYDFARDNRSSVNYAGQIHRQNMLKEIAAYLATFTSSDIGSHYQFTADKLINMYENTNSPFTDASLTFVLDKRLSDKTSASPAHVAHQGTTINWFKGILEDAASAATHSRPATPGSSGVLGTTNKYLVSEKGVEYSQLFQKALMGACFMDQAVNNYLTDAKLINNDQVVAGENYTTMEHSWDEAYGYFSKVNDFKLEGTQDRGFWGGYFVGLETSHQLASKTYTAFRRGRAAIVAKDYSERDKQRAIIRQNFEEACLIKALHYLGESKKKISANNIPSAFHELSEGLGFIYSLQYAPSGKVTAAKAEQWLNTLTTGQGFWSSDINTKITTVKTELANLYSKDPLADY
jgi:hypothetical protein